MDNNIFVKRPNADETEADILAMQESWKEAKNKTGIMIHKMKKKTAEEIPSNKHEVPSVEKVLYPVQEKNINMMWECGNVFQDFKLEEFGFPKPLDLKEYHTYKKQAQPGKSYFASAFDDLHGQIETSNNSEEKIDSSDFRSENNRIIADMDAAKIEELQKELQQKLDSKTLEFLANRHKKKLETAALVKISKFKQAKLADDGKPTNVSIPQNQSIPEPSVSDDLVKQLEVLDEFCDRKDEEKYNRLATDAVQMDFATKCLKTMMPRQQQNAVRLFDILKTSPSTGSDILRDLARSKLEDIKQLYLEEVESNGRRFMQFGASLNPLLDSCWMLRPIRSVLDAMLKRKDNNISPDDIDIVRLSLLWTLLLFEERPSAFFAFSELQDFYVRLAEVFLLGFDIIADDISMQCVDHLMNNYVFKSAKESRLSLRLHTRVADLDAFAPFFQDLLRHYESYSIGNISFTRALLIGSYLNTAISDSIECRFSIWTPKKDIARQMTIRRCDANDILTEIRRVAIEQTRILEDQHYSRYIELLGAYAAAIRDEKVTRERNELMFTIAAEELGRFVTQNSVQLSEEKKHFKLLVDIIRNTVKDKISLA